MHRRAGRYFWDGFQLEFFASLSLALLGGRDGSCIGRIPTFLPTGDRSCFTDHQSRQWLATTKSRTTMQCTTATKWGISRRLKTPSAGLGRARQLDLESHIVIVPFDHYIDFIAGFALA